MLSAALGTAIGLIFIFFLFSLFLSSVLEIIAAALKLRARALEVALKSLINDPEAPVRFGGFGLLDRAYHALPKALGPSDRRPRVQQVSADEPEVYEAKTEAPDGDFLETLELKFSALFCHPMVGGTPSGKRPSYVPAENFASALLALLRRDGTSGLAADVERGIASLPPSQMRDALTTIAQEAQGDWDRLRSGVEAWYDHAMDRLSGEYKRYSQAVTFLIALLLAVLFNIDALSITQRLYVDPVLRAALEAQATSYVQNAEASPKANGIEKPTPPTAETGEQVARTEVPVADGVAGQPANTPLSSDTSNPAGTPPSGAAMADPETEAPQTPLPSSSPTPEEDFKAKMAAARTARDELMQAMPLPGWSGDGDELGVAARLGQAWTAVSKNPLALFGWLVTALAAMLGAPFWFDLLQKLVNLRGTGPKPVADRVRQGEGT